MLNKHTYIYKEEQLSQIKLLYAVVVVNALN